MGGKEGGREEKKSTIMSTRMNSRPMGGEPERAPH